MEQDKWADSLIITVLGSTGTGKSKLGIELAQEFNGEIISADSIQVYKGLDVCSAKVTIEEEACVKHHLLSVAECTDSYDVVKFRDTALPIIADILDRGKVPIIVGGTNYYIESLIWKMLMSKSPVDQDARCTSNASSTPLCSTLDSDDRCQPQATPSDSVADSYSSSVGITSSSSPYERLQKVDPEMAARLHPNNTRKIQRSLDVHDHHGVSHSQLLAEQRDHEQGTGSQGAQLRFPKTCAFWIRCEMEVLDKRLSKRVDGMAASGMMPELEEFHSRHGQQCLDSSGKPSFEWGLFQSIGYKELYPYLSRPASLDAEASASLQAQCLQSLVTATCRYARKQNTWIRNRFLNACQQVPLYGVDSSNPDNWLDDVLNPAQSIVRAHIAGLPIPIAPLALRVTAKNSWKKYECTSCCRVLHGDQEWKAHLASRMHRRRRKRAERRRSGGDGGLAEREDRSTSHHAVEQSAPSSSD